MAKSQQNMQGQARYGSLPFDEAIKQFKAKLNLPSERWADVWRDAHNSGFMVAGAMGDNLLNDFRQAVDTAIAEGKSIGWFKREFNAIVKKHGWEHTGNADWRARIIYDTNMRQSYNAGRWQQLQQFDVWQYQHGDSITPRKWHLKWHGLTLSKDDPFWHTHFPQNGWGCKCKVRGLRRVKDEDLNRSPEPIYRDYVDPVTGEVHRVPQGIDPGFDYAPTKAQQAKQQTKHREQAAKPFTPPERLVPTAFSTVKNVNIDSLNKALEALMATDAAPELAKLLAFIKERDLKTLFIKSTEMGKGDAAWAIADEVAEYLGLTKYQAKAYHTSASKPEGFTSQSFDHVVIKVKANHNLAKVDAVKLRSGLAAIIEDGANQTGKYPLHGQQLWWAFTEASGDMHDNTGRLLTWIHEMGHQVHYKLGMPEPPMKQGLTHYSMKSPREWFAEHFSAYVLARETLNSQWPDVVKWFDEQMGKLN
ncbi:phage minor head protein [Motilimonas sp. 1_MG-2023]|uniref:phage minor head protein n=1 Tax=Motilimonas sp. 1_MG-2023 TaxID=3062672 RepID=UPI0026E332B1|nr:phage minor head protein [Motilimonas sp. 1_MG-2023]MDO6526954.1 phage minor head protein [Motilimonas sp. 1_MG-2023]